MSGGGRRATLNLQEDEGQRIDHVELAGDHEKENGVGGVTRFLGVRHGHNGAGHWGVGGGGGVG